jgi:hypothetical protein
MERNVIKLVRVFDDGSTEYIDGQSLENYNYNVGICNGIITSRSYIQMKPVEWTYEPKAKYSPLQEFIVNEQQYGKLFEENPAIVEFEEAIRNFEIENDARNEAFVKSYNEIFDVEKEITIDDLRSDDYEDLQDLCEIYHQKRNREK